MIITHEYLEEIPIHSHTTYIQRTKMDVTIKCIPLAHNFHIPKYTCKTGRNLLQCEDVLILLRAPKIRNRF